MRSSREASSADISAPSKPTTSSWPTSSEVEDGCFLAEAFMKSLRQQKAGVSPTRIPSSCQRGDASAGHLAASRELLALAAVLHLPLQLRQQVERIDRGEPVEIGFPQAFEHRLRQRGED